MKKFIYVILAAMLAVSCDGKDGDKDKNKDLLLEDKYTVTCQPDSELSAPIFSGNKDYSVSVTDESIAEVTTEASETGSGRLVISPKKVGVTTATVTDNVTGQEREITVEVVNAYFSFSVDRIVSIVTSEDDDTHAEVTAAVNDYSAGLDPDLYYCMVRNNDNRLYVFDSAADAETGDFLYRGKFSFDMTEEGYIIRFVYAKDDEPVSITCSIYDTALLEVVNKFFSVGWNIPKTRLDTPPVGTWDINIIEMLTSKYITDYPELTFAGIGYNLSGLYPMDPAIDTELLQDEILE